MAGRIVTLSTTFGRSLRELGIAPRTPRQRLVMASVAALTSGDLPGPNDQQTRFANRGAHARRVPRQNVWILYRFDAERVYVLKVRAEPPVPLVE